MKIDERIAKMNSRIETIEAEMEHINNILKTRNDWLIRILRLEDRVKQLGRRTATDFGEVRDWDL